MKVNWFRTLVLVVAVGMLPAIGVAQTSDQTARGLEFNSSQRQTIYQSISKTQKNSAAPIGFRPAVGSVVPLTQTHGASEKRHRIPCTRYALVRSPMIFDPRPR